MPQKQSNKPPKAMTWGKATPALVISGIFDALRLMFVGFIFFGPAMAGLYCDYKVSDWIGSAFGLTSAACGAAVATGAFFSAPALMAFGMVMAMAVGLTGWLAVGGWLLATNSRIFKENALWFVGSLLFSEVPFVGAIPAITVSVWKMHSHQIKIEKAALKKWEKENAEKQAKKRSEQAAQLMQMQQLQAVQQTQSQVVQQAQLVAQDAANDENYKQIQAANDDQYTQETKKAA